MTDLCRLIQLVLMKNSFIFNETNYLQIHVTTWERVWCHHTPTCLWESSTKSSCRSSPKDLECGGGTMTTLWAHGEPSLQVIIDNLNRHDPTITFTASW